MERSTVSGTSRVTASELLAQYNERAHVGHREVEEEEVKLKRLYAARSAHLPGNNWCQDWIQWMRNNHPLLGLCCRHQLNPVGIGPRMVILICSISFGLLVTNLVYLFYRNFPDANGAVISIDIDEDGYSDYSNSFVITYEMIVLWTLGGLLHSLLDLGMWHLTACACCIQSCIAKAGPYVAIAIAAVISAAATLAVVWRAMYEDNLIENSSANNVVEGQNNEWIEVSNIQSFQFLYSYYLELMIVWFFTYPIMATIFFSGAVWSCIPCIGGRPKEIKRQEDEAKKKQTNNADEEIV